MSSVTTDKKLISKIADELSVMDKNADIQRDKKSNIIYDKSIKDKELVKWEDDIEIKYQDDTLWLTQKMIAKLFDVNIPAISKHLQNIYESEELDKSSTISKMEIVQHEGSREVTRTIDHYNLDAVISVGYRVNSIRATQFRRWATSVLSKFAAQGCLIVLIVLINERARKRTVVV